ncbi:MAG TPA: hypothetical protein VJI97_00165 [Candidatus Nanoarchaeia archaeon]|nr:hypothetical protein [Candidatus Nanoarchaeia archaeon]
MSLKKRGYFFVFDSLLGLMIIIIGIVLINSFYVKVRPPAQATLLSDDLLNFLSTKKIKDINNAYAGIGGVLWSQGHITNADNTLLQQAGELYKKKKYSVAEQFILNVSDGTVPTQYRYEVWMDNTLMYPRNPDAAHISSKSATRLLVVSRKITFGIMNATTAETFGPYKSEVYIWEK